MVKIGCFDSIYLEYKCPYCKKVSEMEFQTKKGRCCQKYYKIGQQFEDGQFRKILAWGTCQSLTCQFESAKESVWIMGYYGGFSRGFDAYIYCDSKGRITNKVKVIRLGSHKGIMKGILGELKGKEDNMKIVQFGYYNKKKKKWIEAKMEPMTTNGWLDKFREESFDGGKQSYKLILDLYNLEDSEKAMSLWFIFRYRLIRIINYLKENLKLKKTEELVSIFLSNKPEDLIAYVLNEQK